MGVHGKFINVCLLEQDNGSVGIGGIVNGLFQKRTGEALLRYMFYIIGMN